MKTSAITNTPRAVQTVLSLLCAGFLGLSLGGCAGTYYAEGSATPESRFNTYYGPYYYPTTYYAPGYPYSYYDYGPTYERTIVRSGTRYNDAYGPRYYGSTVYGDWY